MAVTKKTGTVGAAKPKLDFSKFNALQQKILSSEKEHLEELGSNNNFIQIAGKKGVDPVTKKGSEEYIEGVTRESFYIKKAKIALGDTVSITPLGLFKLYRDSTPPESKGGMRKWVRNLHPSQAEQIPLKKGTYFDRAYFDEKGIEHLVQPAHWLYVRLNDFPKIENALIPFQSKGNTVFLALRKLIEENGGIATKLRFDMTVQIIDSDVDGQTMSYLYPDFTLAGENYETDEDGNITGLVKGGFTMEDLDAVLTKAADLQEDYMSCNMVREVNLSKLVAGMTSADKKEITSSYKEDADEEEFTDF